MLLNESSETKFIRVELSFSPTLLVLRFSHLLSSRLFIFGSLMQVYKDSIVLSLIPMLSLVRALLKADSSSKSLSSYSSFDSGNRMLSIFSKNSITLDLVVTLSSSQENSSVSQISNFTRSSLRASLSLYYILVVTL